MRLDKYLKVSRLVKRRTVANQLCDAGQVWVNDKAAKAGYVVVQGDELAIQYGNTLTRVTVDTVPEKAVPAQLADSLYTVIERGSVEAP